MGTYLLGATDESGRTLYAAYQFATSSEARRRAYLRLSTPGMKQVCVWKLEELNWKFIDVFLLPED